MDVRHTLVLLLALWNFTSALQELEVVLFPKFPHLYMSDEVTLRCKRGSEVLTTNVTWFFNGQPQQATDGVLHIAMVTLSHSGKYVCEKDGIRSLEREIDVLDMEALHKLTLLSRSSLVYPGGWTLMELYVETGIHGWQCRYTKQGVEYYVYLPHEDDWRDNKRRATIHAEVRGGDKSAIFWCKNKDMRSNAVTLRVSNKLVMLQALDPMVEGKNVSLICEVRGVDSPDEVVFFKNKEEILRGKDKEYVIEDISNKDIGSYGCEATYSYKHLDPNAPQLIDSSDEQVLRIMAVPSAAQLVHHDDWLECQHPNSTGSFRWYHAESENAEWKSVPSESGSYIYPPVEGFYRCRAEFKDQGVSYPSNTVHSGKALWNFTPASQQPEVVLFPKFPHLYVSDEVTLRCKRGSAVLTTNVNWFFNGQPQQPTNGALSIAMVTLSHSGKYVCEKDGVRSLEREIDVLDMEAPHQLTLLSRRSLVYPGGWTLMELYVETGIHGWQCRYTKQGVEYYVYLPHEDDWRDNKRRATIHAEVKEGDKSAIFWCKNKDMRSNAITLRVSNKLVMLQALDPMVEGKNVSLVCEVRGVDSPDEVVFFKNKEEISRGKEKEYVIEDISNKDIGSYGCKATYSYKHLDPNAPQLIDSSDEQVLRIMAVPSAAQLVHHDDWLECQHPNSTGPFRWYHAETENAEWKSVQNVSGSYIYPPVEGFYRCRAEYKDKGVSYPSNTVHFVPALWNFTPASQELEVVLFPKFPHLYVSDEVTLRCKRGSEVLTTNVTWFFNSQPQQAIDGVLHIAMVTLSHSGKYVCEKDGVRSLEREIDVLDMEAPHQLTLLSRRSLVYPGSGSLMELYVETGIHGWQCLYTKQGVKYYVYLPHEDDWRDNKRRATIHAEVKGGDKSAIFWCENKDMRSNAVTLRVSNKLVMLQALDPMVEGKSVSLVCEVRGVDSPDEVVFFKNKTEISRGKEKEYVIEDISNKDIGSYGCKATYSYKHLDPNAPQLIDSSDEQVLRIMAVPSAAQLVHHDDWLECQHPHSTGPFRWYHAETENAEWKSVQNVSGSYIYPPVEGFYRCRAEFKDKGVSYPSNTVHFVPALWNFTSAAQELEVVLFPKFPHLYVSDEVTLRCKRGSEVLTTNVTWFFNSQPQQAIDGVLHIAMVTLSHSGKYVCEKDGVRSLEREIDVLDMEAPHKLTLLSRRSLVYPGSGSLMELYVETGIHGWQCRYTKQGVKYYVYLPHEDDWRDNKRRATIHAEVKGGDKSAIFWCENKDMRSNAVTLRVSNKLVMLQALDPMVEGKNVSLVCEVRGVDSPDEVVFFKNKTEISRGKEKEYVIEDISNKDIGSYGCKATYSYKHLDPNAPQLIDSSDEQVLRIMAVPSAAQLVHHDDWLECQHPNSTGPFRWYHAETENAEWKSVQNVSGSYIYPPVEGFYRCRAEFKDKGVSYPSNTVHFVPALWNFTPASQQPEVVLFPKFPHLYVSDEVTLRCKRGSEVLTTNVTWFFNSQPQQAIDGVLHIAMVTLSHSGKYVCEKDGVRSLEREIDVLDMEAPHQLTLLSRRSLVYPGSGSLMELYVETGIHGWQCLYTKQGVKYYVYLPHEDDWRDNKRRATIHAEVKGGDKSAIFWCENKDMRSNAVTLRVSNKLVMLQALDPMVEGKNVSLVCEVRGVDSPDEVVFFKNKTEISRGKDKEYVIEDISNKDIGSYGCKATYSYKHLDPNAPQLIDSSDEQVLRIMAVPSAAQLVHHDDWLECQHPNSTGPFRWYHAETENAEWKSVPSESGSYIYPPVEGFYRCRAEFKDKGVSYPSNTVHFVPALWNFTSAAQELEVVLFPKFPHLYVSDEVTLRCKRGSEVLTTNVTWFFNSQPQQAIDGVLHIAMVTLSHSGKYVCEKDGVRSLEREIDVLDMEAPHKLTLLSRRSLVYPGSGSLMELYVETGIHGWQCRYTKQGVKYYVYLPHEDDWRDNKRRATIHAEVKGGDKSAIFWCENKDMRSNAVTLRVSNKLVMLQALDPMVEGKNVSLVCEVRGVDSPDEVVFFKNKTEISRGKEKEYVIEDISNKDIGSYGCKATYSYKHLDPNAPQLIDSSDEQVLRIMAVPSAAQLVHHDDWLECQHPNSTGPFRWYHAETENAEWKSVQNVSGSYIYPPVEGFYRCRAEFKDKGVSYPSNTVHFVPALWNFTSAAQELEVVLFPKFPHLYVSDEVTLRCKRGSEVLTTNVTWFFNSQPQQAIDGVLHIAMVTLSHSGKYVCEKDGVRSLEREIDVLDMEAPHKLTLLSRRSLVYPGSGSLMELYVETGIHGWQCRYTKQGVKYYVYLPHEDDWRDNKRRATIHAEVKGGDKSAIFWCENKDMRSNAVTLRVSNKLVMLQALDPMVEGKNVSLVCEVRGVDSPDEVVFFKNKTEISRGKEKEYVIEDISNKDIGSYGCKATYSYKHLDPNAPQLIDSSDEQVLRIMAVPSAAQLVHHDDWLECQHPNSTGPFRWYHAETENAEWKSVQNVSGSYIYPPVEGFYRCRAEFKDKGVSYPSNTVHFVPALWNFTPASQQPEVVLFPKFPHLYVSDEVTLRCKRGSEVLTTNVTWFFNSQPQQAIDGVLHIAMVTLSHSGKYVCEKDGVRSLEREIDVLDMEAPHQLTLLSRRSLVYPGSGSLMELYVETGIHGWQCLYTKQGVKYYVYLPHEDDWRDNKRRATIHAEVKGGDKSAIFWCENKDMRSNAVTLRVSNKLVMLQALDPMVEGKNVSLVCEVRGVDSPDEVVFFKNKTEISRGKDKEYVIEDISNKDIGSYGCKATYSYKHLDPNAPQLIDSSDEQVLRIMAVPSAAQLVHHDDWLECQHPNSTGPFRWYHAETENAEWKSVPSESGSYIYPPVEGFYRCRAEFKDKGVSYPSNTVHFVPALWNFTSAAQELEVVLFPKFPHLYVSDEVTLRCKRGSEVLTTNVTWFFNSQPQQAIDGVLHIAMVTLSHSGKYVCEKDGVRSLEREIDVLDMEAPHKLTLLSRRSLVYPGSGSLMELYVETGIHGWQCRYTKQGVKYYVYLPHEDDWRDNKRRATIHAEVKGGDKSAIFWCENKDMRSNAVTLRVSNKLVMLQALDPMVEGKNVSLVCEVRGVDSPDEVVFFKNKTEISRGKEKEYVIEDISNKDIGSYGCKATYSYKHLDPNAPQLIDSSDEQVLRIMAVPSAAQLVHHDDWLECQHPNSTGPFRWYHAETENAEWKSVQNVSGSYIYPPVEGFYRCRAEFKDKGVSYPSNTVHFVPALWNFTPASQQPEVVLFPKFLHLYVSDEVTLRCKRGSEVLTTNVTWFFNSQPQQAIDGVLHIAMVTLSHSGKYVCEKDGVRSLEREIDVLDMEAPHQLTLLSRRSLVYPGSGSLMELYVETGIHGWQCLYTKQGVKYYVYLPHEDDWRDNKRRATIHAEVKGGDKSAIFWCENKDMRSNAVTLRVSNKLVMLQALDPMVEGKNVSLVCEVRGVDSPDEVVFFKNKTEISRGKDKEYVIEDISNKDIGSYGCKATYSYKHLDPNAPQLIDSSDEQVLRIMAVPSAAQLVHHDDWLECQHPNSTGPFRWYHAETENAEWKSVPSESGSYIYPPVEGFYRCRAEFKDKGVSYPSNTVHFVPGEPPGK
ncbi:uncharacterized protein LOC134310022 isoform X2 [Trichomycterus rosablanca]|uniref:uncharacterized protein LOC134310022 isoform X2 n=1 Tax=Trichomycterus rosablanca TaxID=2290929 RepID=UPI002F358A76